MTHDDLGSDLSASPAFQHPTARQRLPHPPPALEPDWRSTEDEGWAWTPPWALPERSHLDSRVGGLSCSRPSPAVGEGFRVPAAWRWAGLDGSLADGERREPGSGAEAADTATLLSSREGGRSWPLIWQCRLRASQG